MDKQEPVAWTPQVWRQFRPDGTLEFQKIRRTPNGEWEDYTAPPKREWVGLTDEERNSLWRDAIGWGDPSHDDEDLMKVIEAKLKEKNT